MYKYPFDFIIRRSNYDYLEIKKKTFPEYSKHENFLYFFDNV